MGGSDQWGNITTGTELIRRKLGHEAEAFAITCPLITKADGGKFGKTETGNVWLDPNKTSAYAFYQFWLNCSDEDAEKYIRIFTLLDQTTIDALITAHRNEPHLRTLQRTLATEVTQMVHSSEALRMAEGASQILFGKATTDMLRELDEQTFLDIFDGVPRFGISKSLLDEEVDLVELLAQHTQVFPSKGEARRSLKENAVSVNKQKVSEGDQINKDMLLNNKYLLIQKGKKNYFLILAE
jgi:tyrosyl-tRNA synthetase